jgi:hypothetical protein
LIRSAAAFTDGVRTGHGLTIAPLCARSYADHGTAQRGPLCERTADLF